MRSAVLVLLMMIGPSVAAAHGRPPAIGVVREEPGAPAHLTARGTWGLATSDDGGARWRWVCSAAYGVDARNEDPALEVMGEGRLLLGTFGGLLASEDGGCSWTRPSPALADVFVTDLHAVDAERVLALAAVTAQPDRLFESLDAGATWRELEGDFGEVLVDHVVVAPSEPTRIYASGGIPVGADGVRRPFLMRSDDGGASFVGHELAPEEGERALALWAVDPRDPDILFAEVLHFNGEAEPERIVRSDDGGATWETVLRVPYVGAILIAEDGSVYVGSRLGGLHRAVDGRSFEALDATLPVTCLSESGPGILACVDEGRAGFAMARAEDGLVFSPILRLSEIAAPLSCPACSDVGVTCPAWAPDVVYDLGLDAALPPGFDGDASTGAPRDAGVPEACRSDAGAIGAGDGPDERSGCACRIGAGGPHAHAAVGGLALWLALVVRRRRRARGP